MASKIGKGEWGILFAVTGIIDILQFFGDLFLTEAAAAPEIVNAVADPFIGIVLGGWFQFRGIDMLQHPKRVISLIGIGGLDELTGGIASFWFLDVWYMHNEVKKEGVELEAQRQQEMSALQQQYQYNKDGRRASEKERMERQPEDTPLYNNGVRRITKAKL